MQQRRGELQILIDNKKNELTELTRELMKDLYDELVEVETKLKNIEKRIKLLCKENEKCQRILAVPGGSVF